MAAHSAYVIWYLHGKGEDGEPFLMSDGIGVGYGARPFAAGNDAVYLVAQENYPAEFVESIYPVRLRRYAINPTVYASHPPLPTTAQHSLPGGALPPSGAGLSPAGSRQLRLTHRNRKFESSSLQRRVARTRVHTSKRPAVKREI